MSEDFGAINILVNNAAVTRDGLALRMKPADWDTVIQTNLSGTFFCIQQVLSPMMKERWGRIVNVSSVVGEAGKCGAGELCGVEGRSDRADEGAGAGNGIANDHSECGGAWIYRDRYDGGAEG